jgi:hypothetical protein
MVKLWGTEYSRSDLMQRIGSLNQIGGVEALTLDDGSERGVRALRFGSASGLACTVLPDRGMDISDFAWRGRSLCWHSTTGRVSPALYHMEDAGFHRTFFGGMLTTCGLSSFGPGGDDGGEHTYQHGELTSLLASNVQWGERWDQNTCTMYARGLIRETRLFGTNLTLSRSLEMDLDGSTLRIDDTVCNEGWESVPHMVLYHVNTGFPLLDQGASIQGDFESVTPRDAEGERGARVWNTFEAPQAHFREQVFLTKPRPGTANRNSVRLWNPTLDGGLGLRLSWDSSTLPWMLVWRQLGQGTYVVGMEPVNCSTVTGRADARAQGTLPFLEPGEERRYSLELSVETAAD